MVIHWFGAGLWKRPAKSHKYIRNTVARCRAAARQLAGGFAQPPLVCAWGEAMETPRLQTSGGFATPPTLPAAYRRPARPARAARYSQGIYARQATCIFREAGSHEECVFL